MKLYIRIASQRADLGLILKNFNHKIDWRNCLWHSLPTTDKTLTWVVKSYAKVDTVSKVF